MPTEPSTPTITLRPATAAPSDAELCFSLHALAMRSLITQIWGWDENAQRTYFANSWDQARTQIVLVDDVPRGVLIVEERNVSEEGKGEGWEIHIHRVEIDPVVQGRGIGTVLINGVKQRARETRTRVYLEVWAVNSRARVLYERLGFRVSREEGGKVFMQWEP